MMIVFLSDDDDVHSTLIETSVDRSFELPTSHQVLINGCITLDNVLVCATFAKFKITSYLILSKEIKFVDEFTIFAENEQISAFTRINDSNVALMFESCIVFIDINKHGVIQSYLTRILSTSNIPCAISVWNNSIYLVEQDFQKLCLKELDMSANLRTHVDLPVPQDFSVFAMALQSDVHLSVAANINICISSISIVCLDKRGLNVLWQFRDDNLVNITAMTTDRYNYVYVTNGNKLIVLSPDGNYYKVLFNSQSKLSTIFYDIYKENLVLNSQQCKVIVMSLNINDLNESKDNIQERYI